MISLNSSPNALFIVKVAILWSALGTFMHLQLPLISRSGPVITAAIVSIILLGVIWAFLRHENRSFSSAGLTPTLKWPVEFAAGVALGIAVVAIMGVIILGVTAVEVNGQVTSDWLKILATSFLVMSVLALFEEITFRSYAVFRLRESLGIRASIYITAIVFAFYHGLVLENLLGPGAWGLIYGWMVFKTGNIALATGFHVGLNWLQALFSQKLRYTEGVWDLQMGDASSALNVEQVGIGLQVIVLVVGVVLVERIARQKSFQND
ncbi:MAG: type II CAAX endopeptidase family protein [Pseudomonadota bacterium]